jgi:hypothetical protein
MHRRGLEYYQWKNREVWRRGCERRPRTLNLSPKKKKKIQCSPICNRAVLLKISRICPFVSLVRVICSLRSARSICGMIQGVENGSTRRKTCPSVSLSSTNLTLTGPGSKLDLRGEKPVTSHLSHGTFSTSQKTLHLQNNRH